MYQVVIQGCPTVTLSHRCATEASKHVTGLLNLTYILTTWRAEPFIYFLDLLSLTKACQFYEVALSVCPRVYHWYENIPLTDMLRELTP